MRNGYNFFTYITTNPVKTILYIGVTNDLERRIRQHYDNRGKPERFASKFYCYNLVYFDSFSDINAAIAREKEIKGWTRKKKEMLIGSMNPAFRTLKPWQG